MEEAHMMTKMEHWNGCINRLYYVCFYAVSALLLRDGMSSSKHTGVRGLFNLHYVKTGEIPAELAHIYNDLFEDRNEGDYVDLAYFHKEDVLPLIPGVESFLNHVIQLIDKNKIS
ncbi:MAG: HEPN domain-containing protein [Desulfamplus sp.]|nr:HEPN domain-containing protein [Desulfamplus sp.]